ncbi:unnamed protein product [Meloidogyne enterolobii]|uniref:Uncharacterized protein n=1 Tax=Meloidogyne enterolobii TaxID=390850 RepID=A0ACB1A8P5_MELEN
MHCSGALLTAFALLFSFLGHFGHNWKTICSAILYICGALIVLIGVLQVICIVDDEMAPRMKPNAAGEPSVTAFFLRHQTPTDKSLVVPGLHELLNQVTIIRTRTHRLGRLGGFALQGSNNGGGSSGRFANRRRSSRASKDLSGMMLSGGGGGLNGGEPVVQRVFSFQHLFV